MRPIIRPGKVLAIAVVAGSLSGCSALGPSSDEANAVVAAFVQALQAGDGIQACALLNSAAADGVESRTGSDCDRGILSLGLPATMSEPKSTEVYGRSALVQSSEESIFLTVEESQWKIRAAGCRPVEDAPFDCLIDGS